MDSTLTTEPRARSSAIPRTALALAGAALLVKLWLAATTRGTNDVEAFSAFLREYLGSGAIGLYEHDPEFNHPPFVLHFLMAVRWLVHATGIAFPFWLRLPAILADFGSFLVVASLLGERLADRSARWSLALVAAAPVSIMVSGFHGNTDPVMIFLALDSVLLLVRDRPVWMAGLAMGASLCVKVVPIVFWPALLLWIPGWRKRLEYFGAAALLFVALSSPVLFQAPALVARKVFGYGSSYGLWGLSQLVYSQQADPGSASELFRSYGRIPLLVALVGLSWWMNRRERKTPLFLQLGVIAFAFLTFTPGFGLQYLAWLVPFTVLLPLGAAIFQHAACGWFLFVIYTFWSQMLFYESCYLNWWEADFWRQGLPWNVADCRVAGEWRGPLVPLAIAAWVSVVIAFACLLRAAQRGRGSTQVMGSAAPRPRSTD